MIPAASKHTVMVAAAALGLAVSSAPGQSDGPAASAASPADSAPAETAIALSRRGLSLLGERQPGAAADAMQRALDLSDGSLDHGSALASTRYNLALARAQSGDLPGTEETLRELESLDVEPELRARARFNRGHALFTEAAQMAEADPAAAIERYLRAAEAFRLAAAMGTDEATRAARNVEISRLAAQRLRDQLQQEQERQQQAQEMADQLRDLAERQQQLADETESRGQSDQPEDLQTEDLQQQQDELRQQAQELLDQMRQSEQQQDAAEPTPEQSAADDIQQATSAQDQASRELDEQRPDTAAQEQQRAADLLRQAAERLAAQPSETPSDEQGEPQEGEPGEPQESEQEAEAEARDSIAERLLERERAEREARQRVRGTIGRIVPVEKDW